MPRYKLTIEYDGSRYHGWQYQRESPTIMGALMDAVRQVYGPLRFELYGAGRTDAGVHAMGQVAHLDLDSQLPPRTAMQHLNQALPRSIAVLSMEMAPRSFHARHDAVARSYVYHIARRKTAFGKNHVWWVKPALNLQGMADAASLLEGRHDFRSFGRTEREGMSTVVELQRVRLYELDASVVVHVLGSHFLWRMVRRMVGTLVEVGLGGLSPKQVEGFLHHESDIPTQLVAPPSGLYLEHVYYPGEPITDEPAFTLNI
ncbi:MAG: tRNA pseudouridine(38-40) synthase TruA [Bacteroidales bacterium]|nr:tRNA pseudouridine(38-40) synthase TruA [Bacteroidales bacterium]